MKLLHEELRAAREKAGLTQQGLARLAGIPRNQIVRAEGGENITIDTLRKIAVHLPLTELTLLDTRQLRVDIIPEPEKLFFAAVQNVLHLTEGLRSALDLALEARAAMEAARRLAPPLPEGVEPPASIDDSGLVLVSFRKLLEELKVLEEGAKAALAP